MERFETKTTQTIARALDTGTSRGGVALITGPNGSGKTTAVEMAMADRGKVRLVKLLAPAVVGTPRAFYGEVARALSLEVAPQAGGPELLHDVVREVRRYELTLVLDNAEDGGFRPSQLPLVRCLADHIPHLVLIGNEALRAQVAGTAALEARVMLPVKVEFIGLDELITHFGAEFSEAWLETVYEATSGHWTRVWRMVYAARQQSERRGLATRDLGAQDAEGLTRALVLRAA